MIQFDSLLGRVERGELTMQAAVGHLSAGMARLAGAMVAPFAFAIVFRAGIRQWPIIAAVAISGVVVSWSIEPRLGVEVASFFSALAVGCSSNLYARICDLPAMVPQTPGMLSRVLCCGEGGVQEGNPKAARKQQASMHHGRFIAESNQRNTIQAHVKFSAETSLPFKLASLCRPKARTEDAVHDIR